MKKYVWCEDSASGFIFWTELFRVLNPDIIVQSKKNNTGLRKAVACIDDCENQYYIFLDSAVDNPDILRELKKLRDISQSKKNVTLINIHSFEFALLSFDELESWVFAEQDELREKRKDILYWKNLFVKAFIDVEEAGILSGIKDALNYSKKYNSEQIASKLLFDITKNTGFETNKGKIGECFINDCCNWETRQSDDICGLDNRRLSQMEKMRNIHEKSVLKNALSEVDI